MKLIRATKRSSRRRSRKKGTDRRKNLFETHEGGLGQDDSENKQKVEEAYGDGAKILDWSNQDEPSFEELDEAETEELAENDPGELREVVKMRDESKNGKGLGEA